MRLRQRTVTHDVRLNWAAYYGCNKVMVVPLTFVVTANSD